jgi:hypothetical protein
VKFPPRHSAFIGLKKLSKSFQIIFNHHPVEATCKAQTIGLFVSLICRYAKSGLKGIAPPGGADLAGKL